MGYGVISCATAAQLLRIVIYAHANTGERMPVFQYSLKSNLQKRPAWLWTNVLLGKRWEAAIMTKDGFPTNNDLNPDT